MMPKTSVSSDSSPSRDSGATDSLWRPSWWRWLISALSGTVAIKKQTAWLRKSNEELRKSTEELRKSNEELRKSSEDARIQHEQRLRELRKENARLAELESKIDGLFSKYNIKLPQGKRPEQP